MDILGFTFPLPVKDVPKFEKNLFISVNVLCSGDESGYVPLYVSKDRNRSHHVNLFLLEGPDDTHHYVWNKTCHVWSPAKRQLVMQPLSAATVYIQEPKRTRFGISEQSGSVSSPFLSGLRLRFLSHHPRSRRKRCRR